MRYHIRIELLKEFENIDLDFESTSPIHILAHFDRIDWKKQAILGAMEEYQGEFPFFQIEQLDTGRKIGGLFVVYGRSEFAFNTHAELYQKQQKSHFFGLFKTEGLPEFNNDDVPFELFRDCLDNFLEGHDSIIEGLLETKYPKYS